MSEEPEVEMCECGEPIKPGDLVYHSIDGGYLHADCCGDPDSFVNLATGDPLGPDVSPPQPFPYEPNP